MKLYYATGACSLAPHIALREAGLPFELVRVDLGKHTLTNGTDYTTINPKGYVPLLELDNGERLSEVAVILQYIADRKPGTLAPAYGTMERYRVMEWLNFVATEIHKGMGPLWKADTTEAVRGATMQALSRRFDYVVATLAKQPYLTGSSFGIADAYLFTIVNWHNFLKFDLARWPALQAFQERVAARPKVNEALVAEHLVRKPVAAAA